MGNRTLQLNWKGYYEYISDNVQKYAPTKAGVYKISVKQQDDTLKVRYVGQANDLDRRLKKHLDVDNEQNECLAERIRKYHTEFSFAEISNQDDRDGAERALYNHYKPTCNDPDAIPDGPDIDINHKK
jgi:excinuclease UvrABC nuclease subunit